VSEVRPQVSGITQKRLSAVSANETEKAFAPRAEFDLIALRNDD
jgi:hypothetical protein